MNKEIICWEHSQTSDECRKCAKICPTEALEIVEFGEEFEPSGEEERRMVKVEVLEEFKYEDKELLPGQNVKLSPKEGAKRIIEGYAKKLP